MKQIVFKYPSYYLIPNVTDIPRVLQTSLAVWNRTRYRYEEIGYHYDIKSRELRIPRGYPEEGIRYMFPDCQFEECKGNTWDSIDIKLTNSPRDYIQMSVFSFMTGNKPFEYTRNMSQIFVDLDTGRGKTYLAIATACYFKMRMVVFTASKNKSMTQWIDSIGEFTSLKRTEYLLVRGTKMCEDIIAGKYQDIKIFVIPRSTVSAFIRSYDNDWSLMTILVNAMQVNIKAVDEAHMDFSTMVKIDCFTNVPKTIYMSSSPERSRIEEEKIYYRIFKGIPRYGKSLVTKEQRHIIPLIMQFSSKPTDEQLRSISTLHGPSLSKYGKYLLDPKGARDEFLDAYLYSMIFLQKYRRRGGKILVLCITVEFAKELCEYTNKMFPYLSTGMFVGSGKNKDDELNNDVVFSTKESMGVASEFVNHQMTINTITYSSQVLADQIPGRIRAQDNRKAIYCEIVNMTHKVAREQYLTREPYLKKKARNGEIMVHEITDADKRYVDRFFNDRIWINQDGDEMDEDGAIIIQSRKHK